MATHENIIDYAKLTIKDQSAIVNAIAGTYKDVYRACMEYIDNAVDAAYVRSRGGTPDVRVDVLVDEKGRAIIVRDNAGGMNAEELKDLLESIGLSKKKTVSWANGQFGFGVHAFRAFASEAQFSSRVDGGAGHRLVIDRNATEHDSVPIIALSGGELEPGCTEVRISRFDKGVFKKRSATGRLREEIQTHFQDVLSEPGIRIFVGELGTTAEKCTPFDHTALPGVFFTREFELPMGDSSGVVTAALKLLDEVARGRSVRVTAKGRRIASLADLVSFRRFCRQAQRDPSIWSDPCLVGVIEVGETLQPNLTRDDLRSTDTLIFLYEQLVELQAEIEDVVNERRRKKMGKNRKHVGDMVSSYLAKYMRGFKFMDEFVVGNATSASASGGEDPGGGTAGADTPQGDGTRGEVGRGGEGDEEWGGGAGPARKKGEGAKADRRSRKPSAPNIVFDDYEGGDRSFLRGYDIVVNTAHEDYLERNKSRDGIVVNERMLSYVATVISPICVVSIAEKKGHYLEPLRLGMEIAGFSLGLEKFLQENAGKLKRD